MRWDIEQANIIIYATHTRTQNIPVYYEWIQNQGNGNTIL